MSLDEWNWVFTTNSDFIIPISLEPNVVNLWYFKPIIWSNRILSLKYLCIVYDIAIKRYRLNFLMLDNDILKSFVWSRLNETSLILTWLDWLFSIVVSLFGICRFLLNYSFSRRKYFHLLIAPIKRFITLIG